MQVHYLLLFCILGKKPLPTIFLRLWLTDPGFLLVRSIDWVLYWGKMRKLGVSISFFHFFSFKCGSSQHTHAQYGATIQSPNAKFTSYYRGKNKSTPFIIKTGLEVIGLDQKSAVYKLEKKTEHLD